jgi:hypothetical protein
MALFCPVEAVSDWALPSCPADIELVAVDIPETDIEALEPMEEMADTVDLLKLAFSLTMPVPQHRLRHDAAKRHDMM